MADTEDPRIRAGALALSQLRRISQDVRNATENAHTVTRMLDDLTKRVESAIRECEGVARAEDHPAVAVLRRIEWCRDGECPVCGSDNTDGAGVVPVTHAIWRAAGQPAYGNGTEGVCRTCGRRGSGERFQDWVKSTFTDRAHLHPGNIVCQACLMCFDDRQPQLTAMTGKSKPQRMRNYSHFVVGGQWRAYTKGQKAEMRRALDADPSVAVVSVTGQKHLLFKCPAARWLLEESVVLPDCAKAGALIARMTEMLAGGFSKAEVESGNYSQGRIIAYGLQRWRYDEEQIRGWRGSSLFALAIYLSTTPNTEDDDDTAEDS